MRADIVARAPTRIDLGGGWTDVPPYCDREGGFVCNVAISRYAIARLREARFPTPVGAHSASSAGGGSESDRHDAPLVTAALKRSGVDDVRVTIENDFPVGAGLGGSSA